jgi:TPR repeat protein
MFVYSPPVGRESVGQVIPVRTGAGNPGLPEAQYRLALLHLAGNGVPVDEARAKALLEQAANAGYAPAVSELQNLHEQAARPRQ